MVLLWCMCWDGPGRRDKWQNEVGKWARGGFTTEDEEKRGILDWHHTRERRSEKRDEMQKHHRGENLEGKTQLAHDAHSQTCMSEPTHGSTAAWQLLSLFYTNIYACWCSRITTIYHILSRTRHWRVCFVLERKENWRRVECKQSPELESTSRSLI